jgi:hypothetical protein
MNSVLGRREELAMPATSWSVMTQAWDVSSNTQHGWLECVHFPCQNKIIEYVNDKTILIKECLVLEFFCSGLRYYLATVEGD